MSFSDKQIAKLKGPLDRKFVKPPAPGKFGDYMEGWRAIDEANNIFGHDGWSYEVVTIGETHRELCDLKGNNSSYQQWRVSYIATVVVHAGGVSRSDVGGGQGQAKPASLGDAVESAAKEAVTDALKRALRSFGNPLGLALYDKTQANVADAPQKTRAERLLEQRAVGKRFDSKADSARVFEAHKAFLSLATSQAELASYAKANKRELDHLMDEHWAEFMIAFNDRKKELPEGVPLEDAA